MQDLQRARKRKSGFTLIEVLATLALLAIVLPVAMKGISTSVRAADLARDRMVAATLADTKLAETIVTGEWLNGDASGDFGDEYPGFAWELEVTDWQDVSLSQLDVTVEWPYANDVRSLTLTTVVVHTES